MRYTMWSTKVMMNFHNQIQYKQSKYEYSDFSKDVIQIYLIDFLNGCC